MTTPHGCDVIIPVFNAAADFARLIESLLAARNRTQATIFVVDDASSEDVHSLVPQSDPSRRFVYLRNPRNLGFAGSVNRVLSESVRDVVLLNSDCRVFDDWLDRLIAVFARASTIGTVTPLSNAATILSYPRSLVDNGPLTDVSWAELDVFCRRAAWPPVDIPTGVGFCMAVRRSCIADVGILDTETFGRGYGEENDFCRRAISRGWRNVAAPNVFVWHKGGASFKDRRRALCDEAQRTLHQRYPDYHASVRAFIAADPLRDARASLDAARIAHGGSVRIRLGGAGNASRREIGLQRSGRWWRPLWRLARAGEPPFCNLNGFGARSRTGDLEALLTSCAVREVIVPARRELPRRLIERFVQAAEKMQVPVFRERAR